MNHPTFTPNNIQEVFERGPDPKWYATIITNNEIYKDELKFHSPSKLQALQKAWKMVEENHEYYDIDNWGPGKLTIKVTRIK